jgi:CheY-like chemotaxis protein
MPDEPKEILAVMSDLFFAAKINDAAKKLGMTAVFVNDKALALEHIASNPAVVIFDLNCTSVDPIELLGSVRALPTVGFISHVQTELKQKAVDRGCQAVFARSVFAQNLPAILEKFATAAPAPAAD